MGEINVVVASKCGGLPGSRIYHHSDPSGCKVVNYKVSTVSVLGMVNMAWRTYMNI